MSNGATNAVQRKFKIQTDPLPNLLATTANGGFNANRRVVARPELTPAKHPPSPSYGAQAQIDAKISRIDLGSTGCQPVGFGGSPKRT
jgi:hypothetical protein